MKMETEFIKRLKFKVMLNSDRGKNEPVLKLIDELAGDKLI
jgi:hypothetical protein